MEYVALCLTPARRMARRAGGCLHHWVLLVILFAATHGAAALENAPPHDAADRIPFAVALWNIAGGEMDALIKEDAAALGTVFSKVKVYPAHEVPQAMMVFAYAGLTEEGMLAGYPAYDVKQLALATRARLFVLAAGNSAGSVKAAAERKGAPVPTLVLTLDRNGKGFGRFFRALFDDMRTGTPILSAWVKLAPQHPNANPTHAPATILLAEGGNWHIPESVEAPQLGVESMRMRALLSREQCDRPSRCVRANAMTEHYVADYLDEVSARVKAAAGRRPGPLSDFPGRQTLSLKVRLAKGGGVSRIAVMKPSGNAMVDRWAVDAFRSAAESLDPLPVELLKEGIQSMEAVLRLEVEAGVMTRIAPIPEQELPGTVGE